MTKPCKLCGKPSVHQRNYCNNCQKKVRRYRIKIAAVEYLGGCCSRCGYTGNLNAFDIHHKDPSLKEIEFRASGSLSWDKIRSELDKCVLLCANCHRITHAELAGYDKVLEEAYTYQGKKFSLEAFEANLGNIRNKNVCMDCGKQIARPAKRCSICYAIHTGRMPDAKEVIKMIIEAKSYKNVAEKYGANPDALKKFFIKNMEKLNQQMEDS